MDGVSAIRRRQVWWLDDEVAGSLEIVVLPGCTVVSVLLMHPSQEELAKDCLAVLLAARGLVCG